MATSGRFLAMVLWTLPLLAAAFFVQPLGLAGTAGRALRLRALGRLARVWFQGLLRLGGVRVVRPEALPPGPALVTANHLTYLDILVVGSLFPARFVAKDEIARWPVVGWLARLAGTLFHTRGRARDVRRLTRRLEDTLRAGVTVVLFPEGRCGDGAAVAPFHSGFLEAAVRGRVPCLPLCLHYDLADPAASPRRLVCWTSGENLFRHAARLVRQGGVTVTLRVAHPPLTDTDRKRLARRLHAATRRAFRPIRP